MTCVISSTSKHSPILHVALVWLENLLVVPDRLLELLALHVALGPPEQRLGVAGVEVEGAVAVRDTLGGLLLLGGHRGAVEVQLGVGAPVAGVDQQRLAVQLVGLVQVPSFEGSVPLLLLRLQRFRFLKTTNIN